MTAKPTRAEQKAINHRAIVDAAQAGAAGFILKQIASNELIESIRMIAAGERLLDPSVAERAAARLRTNEMAAIDTLTAKERQVFRLIGAGKSNREIGEEMFIVEKTVKNHVSSVLSKLGLVRRTEAAALAARLAERQRNQYE